MELLNTTLLEWFKSHQGEYRGFFFDIDGTLIDGKKNLPGARRFLSRLRNSHIPFFLLTNDGNHSVMEKSRIMREAGLEIGPEEIISCSMAIASCAEKKQLGDDPIFVMGDLGKPDYAEKAGLTVTRNVRELPDAAAVIVGEGSYDWQKTINAVLNFFIDNPERPMIVPNPDSYWPDGKGGLAIGAGGKARFLCAILAEYGRDIKPVYLGKPYRPIFNLAWKRLLERFELPKNTRHRELVMVGDSLASDIKGANLFGLTSILVLTGITKNEHIGNIRSGSRPDLVAKSF